MGKKSLEMGHQVPCAVNDDKVIMASMLNATSPGHNFRPFSDISSASGLRERWGPGRHPQKYPLCSLGPTGRGSLSSLFASVLPRGSSRREQYFLQGSRKAQ